MKKQALCIVFCLITLCTSAQQVIDTVVFDFSPYKGKLVCMNEAHNVKTNIPIYYSVVEKMVKACRPGDTLNLILEMPYSLLYLYENDLAHTDTSTVVTDYMRGLIVAVIKNKLPVRMVAYDIEYDDGRTIRRENYAKCLQIITQKFRAASIPVTELEKYMVSLKSGNTWLKGEGKDALIAFYKRERNNTKKISTARTITELLYVLSAGHTVYFNRDTLMYRRLLEAESIGFVTYADRYNLLIAGSGHVNSHPGSLYGHFLEKATSPFHSNTYLIAQAYINCRHKDYYNPGENNFITNSIVSIDGVFKKQIDAHHVPSGVATSVTSMETEALNKYRGRILYWYIHNEVR